GSSTPARLGASGDGRQVSLSLFRSRFRPALAVIVIRATVWLTPVRLAVSGTASPGGVETACVGGRVATALASPPPTVRRARRTASGAPPERPRDRARCTVNPPPR